MESYQLGPWVPFPGTFESPEYFPDYIAVAAEECSGSFSQGSSSPETYISTDDILDDLPNPNEDVVNEIVNDMVCEDPSFGSVLIDSDISEILNVETDGCELILNSGFGPFPSNPLVNDTPTRRKQRIVPKFSEPFYGGIPSYLPEDTVHQVGSRSLKRHHDDPDMNNGCYNNKKRVRNAPEIPVYPQDDRFSIGDEIESQASNESDPQSPEISVYGKQETKARQRRRGLTQDERKERKKQSNRNASYRYRQRKKDEMDDFYRDSLITLQAFESEKGAYYDVVEEFVRCIKHAQLVSDARCERKTGLLLKV